MYQVEKNLPIPSTATDTLVRASYPFKFMVVGDSIWVEGDEKVQKRAIGNSRLSGKKLGFSFVFEQAANGVRIWRKS